MAIATYGGVEHTKTNYCLAGRRLLVFRSLRRQYRRIHRVTERLPLAPPPSEVPCHRLRGKCLDFGHIRRQVTRSLFLQLLFWRRISRGGHGHPLHHALVLRLMARKIGQPHTVHERTARRVLLLPCSETRWNLLPRIRLTTPRCQMPPQRRHPCRVEQEREQ